MYYLPLVHSLNASVSCFTLSPTLPRSHSHALTPTLSLPLSLSLPLYGIIPSISLNALTHACLVHFAISVVFIPNTL